jgi:hypothetical protein
LAPGAVNFDLAIVEELWMERNDDVFLSSLTEREE